jgi:hypothetical protein
MYHQNGVSGDERLAAARSTSTISSSSEGVVMRIAHGSLQNQSCSAVSRRCGRSLMPRWASPGGPFDRNRCRVVHRSTPVTHQDPDVRRGRDVLRLLQRPEVWVEGFAPSFADAATTSDRLPANSAQRCAAYRRTSRSTYREEDTDCRRSSRGTFRSCTKQRDLRR